MQCNIDNEIKLIAHDAYDKQSFWKSMCNYDESAFRINALVDSYEKYIYHSYTVYNVSVFDHIDRALRHISFLYNLQYLSIIIIVNVYSNSWIMVWNGQSVDHCNAIYRMNRKGISHWCLWKEIIME